MTHLKRTLLILIPLAVIVVLAITVIAVKLTTGNQGDITYKDSVAHGQISMQTPAQSSSNVFTTNPYNDVPQGTKDDLLTSWQGSTNIKQGKYIPRIAESTEIQDIIDTATHPTPANTPTADNLAQEASDIWSWIPQTILREPEQVKQESLEISTMKTYINEFGTEVKKTINTLGDQPKIMGDFITGRGEVGNADKLKVLGKEYENLGIRLMQMSTDSQVSKDIKDSSYELGNAYKDVGVISQLLANQETTDDTETLKDIYLYNKQVDIFATQFISFANLIGAYGVTFTKGEGGDMFTPPVQ